ncbi:MAG: GNAT family N-acetyltransferase [Pseudomonadota bacterium]
MSVNIRRGLPTDREALRSIHSASWRDAYKDIVPPEAFGAPFQAVMSRRWDQWPADRVIYVAQSEEAGADILGFAALVQTSAPGWCLDNLHMDPLARGQGVGRALFARAARHVLGAQNGASNLWLEVLARNTAARRFYGRLGGVEGRAQDTRLLGYPADYVGVRWDAAALAAIVEKDREPRKNPLDGHGGKP